jgi:alanine dehydrogenase
MSGPLYLTEKDVASLVSVPEAIGILETAFRNQSTGDATANPRQRLRMSGITLHIMAGVIPGYFGYKAYTTAAGKAQFRFYLFDGKTTDLVSVMEADTLGQIRTGAATGLATRILANPNASQATLFGAGWQAQSQLLAMDDVRQLEQVWIVNRNAERRESFIRTMQPLVKAKLAAPESPESAVKSSHVITTMTSSKDPVLKGEWFQAGQHVNAAGGNLLLRRELDDEAVLRADLVVADSVEQARIEAGEFIGVMETGKRHWQDFVELCDVVAGQRSRIRATDITLFKSLGLAIEDVALAAMVYNCALDRGVGKRIPLQPS